MGQKCGIRFFFADNNNIIKMMSILSLEVSKSIDIHCKLKQKIQITTVVWRIRERERESWREKFNGICRNERSREQLGKMTNDGSPFFRKVGSCKDKILMGKKNKSAPWPRDSHSAMHAPRRRYSLAKTFAMNRKEKKKQEIRNPDIWISLWLVNPNIGFPRIRRWIFWGYDYKRSQWYCGWTHMFSNLRPPPLGGRVWTTRDRCRPKASSRENPGTAAGVRQICVPREGAG